jgi:OOP family OmpA-OmpF porin
VDAKGCPTDADGDAVLDGIDQCPDTPRGCTVDAKGCPTDADGDGVCDGVDQCPDTPAGMKVDEKGCPIQVQQRLEELREKGNIEVHDVKFETNKADILPEFQQQLDAIGLALLKVPMLKIEISGHTDSRGSAAMNRKLSQKRADAVKAYLLQKYPTLDAKMFTAKGYGEDKPVATNKTPEGMAQNRRVSFEVLNKDVLQQELEKLLGQPAAAPADTTKQ